MYVCVVRDPDPEDYYSGLRITSTTSVFNFKKILVEACWARGLGLPTNNVAFRIDVSMPSIFAIIIS